MTRRKSSRSTPAAQMMAGLVILAVLIVAGVLYGGDAVSRILGGEATGGEATTSEVTAPREEGGGSGSYYTIYFTEPASYPQDATTGGIEENLIALINEAQSSIDFAVFEFNLQDVADALIAAHQRGVQVRAVYDDEHTADDPQMEQLISAGIPATPDQRGAFMHNKFFVIDRSIVWTGSWNVTINDTFRNNNNAIVIRSSRLAENYTAEFEEMFNGQFGPTSPSQTPNPVFTLDGIRIENYFAPEDNVMPRVVEVVSQATQTIHFMTFSFTDNSLADAMINRAAAGVEVVGIFEQRGANTESSSCPPMLNAGLDVRLDGNPRTFHHKVIIIDGSIVVLGSFNFSANATQSNDENLLIIYDPNVAALYEAEFNRRLSESVMPVGGQCRSS
jgi:phosphatidylserine/phosphatidylglycerophosphate/cardiolipin synthase-like enzyme